MNDSEIRETLAPVVASKIMARCPGVSTDDAVLLAHDLIARLQAVLAAEAIPAPGNNPLPPAG